MRLESKVALVTGGARGIGAAAARLFAKEGARVVIVDTLDDLGRQVQSQIQQSGGECLFVHLDVTIEEKWRQAIDATISSFGKLNILVNNAAIRGEGGVEEMPVRMWDDVMAVNTRGVFLGTKAAIPEMRKAGGGSIIITSSQFGLVGTDIADPAYIASKGAVTVFAKAVALRYAKEGIRVNTVHPGPIKTPANDFFSDPVWAERVNANVPMGRAGEADEVANGMLFLASDESSFVTGAELVIDGGWTAR